MLSTALPRMLVVHVDQGHGPLAGGDARVAAAHAAAADHGHAELGVGRAVGQHGRDAEQLHAGRGAGDGGGCLEEIATRGAIVMSVSLWWRRREYVKAGKGNDFFNPIIVGGKGAV